MKGRKAHEVCNWDTKAEKAKLAGGPEIDRRRRQVRRASMLVTNYVEEQKKEKAKSWKAEAALLRREEMEERRKSFTPAEGYGWKKDGLPSPVVPKFRKKVCYITKKQLQGKVAEEAAIQGECRYHRLQKGRVLKMTEACTCVYCERPSPYQTSSYRNLKISESWTDVSVEGEDLFFHPPTHIEAVRAAKKASTNRTLNKVKCSRLYPPPSKSSSSNRNRKSESNSNRKSGSIALPSFVSPMSSRNFLPNPNHKADTKPKWMQNRPKLTKGVSEPRIKTESSSLSSSTPEWVSSRNLRKSVAVPHKTEVERNIPSWVSPGLRKNSILRVSKKGQLPPWVSPRGPTMSHGSIGPMKFSLPFGGDEGNKQSPKRRTAPSPNSLIESIGDMHWSLPSFGDEIASSSMHTSTNRRTSIFSDDLLSPAPRIDDADDEVELFWIEMACFAEDLKLPPTPLYSE
jgi:hypothetical protein